MTDNEKRSDDLVSELDSIVPCEDAQVRIDAYGGGVDESYLRANRRGLQRLGIQLLKAADARLKDSAQDTVDIDVSDLFHEESDIRLDWIERTNDLDSETHSTTAVRRQGRTEWMWTLAALVLIVLGFLLAAAINGMP